MEKQATEREDDGDSNSMDRISNLPHPILHHILSFLFQDEAVKTSVLSKSWRYLWCSRPKIEFSETYFGGNTEAFMSVLHNTLQRYYDQKLYLQKFSIAMSLVDSEPLSLLEKWIPRILIDMGVRTFDLSSLSLKPACFDFPSVVFEAESLKHLYLESCKLNPKPLDKVLFKHLKTLSLKRVYIAEETLEKILSSCPLIEYLVLSQCEGLKTIKVNKPHNIKYFDFSDYLDYRADRDITIEVEINVETLETIRIEGAPNWFQSHHHKYFPYLKSLYLDNVRLSTKSFDSFSCNFPCLEELSLFFCSGFEEFQVVIDVPNIVSFHYEGDIPRSISFTTASSEWKSDIVVWSNVNFDYDASSWCLKLNELLKALSESEISLDIQHCMGNPHVEEPPNLLVADNTCGGFYEPVVVGHLHLSLSGHSFFSLSALMNNLFCICRPRVIRDRYLYADLQSEWEREHTQLTELLCEILLMETETRHYLWQRDLEEVSTEAFDENGVEWNPVMGTSLPNNQSVQPIRFRLKWRELS
ncbi:hypothetical protein DH2020_004919 [Rehmannia glutinosa]|uniref:F-box domain-containing protein n=1 Tax=Rehmannia glutinosa TaxID=99300 RepID=A0ABR0XQQ6_REHGL